MKRKLNVSKWFLVCLLAAMIFTPLLADVARAEVKASDFKRSMDLQTIGHLDFESAVKTAADAGWPTVSLRIAKLEEYYKTGKTIDDAIAFLNQYKLTVPQLGFFANWLNVKGQAQEDMLDRFRKFSATAKKLGNADMLLVTMGEGPQDTYDQALAVENFKKICEIAAADGNRVASEFLPYSPVKTVTQMWAIVKAANMPNGGIVLDPYHYFKGGSTLDGLRAVPIEKMFIVHTNDLPNSTPDVDLATLTRNYRVMPGEGSFPNELLLKYLFDRGYSGYYIQEILNKDYAKEDPLKIAVQARETLEKMLVDYAREHAKTVKK